MAQAAEVTDVGERGRRRGDAAEQRRRGDPAADGGTERRTPEDFVHVPVMLAEVLRFVAPAPGQVAVDATLGGGGHAAAVIESLGPRGRLIGLDQDPAALAAAEARLRPLAAAADVGLDIVHGNFAGIEAVLDGLDVPQVHAVYFDLGVSSHQLDAGERGFSYREDAPLDMRMDPGQRTTAYHLVNGLSEPELADLIFQFGEERWARRIAVFIVRRRQERGLIGTTGELVEVIKAAVPVGARRDGPHPARRTFQALRIAVNNELGALEGALRAAARRLVPGGRLVVISFHSLEDRIAKQVIRELAAGCTCPPEWPVCRCGAQPLLRALTPRPVPASAEEAAANPRARSAKLRAAMRLPVEAPAGGEPTPGGAAEPDAGGRSRGHTGRRGGGRGRSGTMGAAVRRVPASPGGDGGGRSLAAVPSVAETLHRGRRLPVLDIRRGE